MLSSQPDSDRYWSMPVGLMRRFSHLRNINSVTWSTLLRALICLYPDYFSGRGRSHAFVNVTLELTYRCSFHCAFCFLKGNALNRKCEELSLEELAPLVKEAAKHGWSFFLTGGEPFIRSDCLDIIRLIKSHGLKVGVNTNLYYLDEAKIDALCEMGLDYIITSLHGPQAVHDQVTGTKSFDKVHANLRYFHQKGASTRLLINNVLTEQTLEHMEAIVRIAAETGVSLLTFQHASFLLPSEAAAHHKVWRKLFGADGALELGNQVRESGMEMSALERHIQRATSLADQYKIPVYFKPDLDTEALKHWYSEAFRLSGRCSYCYTDIRINPAGDVISCQPIPAPMGNIRDKTIGEIINGPKMVAFRKGIRQAGGLFPGCARCCKLYRKF